ncbi:Alpha-mannosidase 2C1 [Nymphon striatum]|nr:Alpha-mannosidase 2C1 [Nymphon striatum]
MPYCVGRFAVILYSIMLMEVYVSQRPANLNRYSRGLPFENEASIKKKIDNHKRHSLLLLAYLVRNGSERVVTGAREHIYDLRSLENYTYIDEIGKDQGINIRQRVKDLIDFIQDDDKLREERKKAKKTKDKFIGLAGGTRSNYNDDFESKKKDFNDFDSDHKKFSKFGFGRRRSLDNKLDYKDRSDCNMCEQMRLMTRVTSHHISIQISIGQTDEDNKYESDDNKNEFKDNTSIDSFEYQKSEKKPSTQSNKEIKKVSLGAAANFGQKCETTNGSSETSTTQNNDLLADLFGSSAANGKTDGSNDFADFSNFQSSPVHSNENKQAVQQKYEIRNSKALGDVWLIFGMPVYSDVKDFCFRSDNIAAESILDYDTADFKGSRDFVSIKSAIKHHSRDWSNLYSEHDDFADFTSAFNNSDNLMNTAINQPPSSLSLFPQANSSNQVSPGMNNAGGILNSSPQHQPLQQPIGLTSQMNSFPGVQQINTVPQLMSPIQSNIGNMGIMNNQVMNQPMMSNPSQMMSPTSNQLGSPLMSNSNSLFGNQNSVMLNMGNPSAAQVQPNSSNMLFQQSQSLPPYQHNMSQANYSSGIMDSSAAHQLNAPIKKKILEGTSTHCTPSWDHDEMSGKTWNNIGSIDISLDNLNPTQKYEKPVLPSMNQMAVGETTRTSLNYDQDFQNSDPGSQDFLFQKVSSSNIQGLSVGMQQMAIQQPNMHMQQQQQQRKYDGKFINVNGSSNWTSVYNIIQIMPVIDTLDDIRQRMQITSALMLLNCSLHFPVLFSSGGCNNTKNPDLQCLYTKPEFLTKGVTAGTILELLIYWHKRTTLERIDKFISPVYFTDVNLFGRLYSNNKHQQISDITHYAAPDRVPFSEVQDKTFQKTKVGESFGPTWSTHWFKSTSSQSSLCLDACHNLLEGCSYWHGICAYLNISIPSEWCGCEVHLRWNSGSEALIFDSSGFIDKLQANRCEKCECVHIARGISHQERSHYQLCKEVSEECLSYVIYIEMACNTLFGAGADSMIAPPDPDKYFTLGLAEIAVFDREVYDLLVDLELIHDLAKHLSDENPRCYNALYAGNEIINVLTKVTDKSTLHEAKSLSKKFFLENGIESEHVIHAIGHCHIDSAWLWPYAETVRKCARSWSSAIQLMKQYPQFTFACSQAQQFEWIKEKYPPLFQEIKAFVKSGQFIPVGSTWIEMDGNIPSGESFIRQFLYGQKFFQEEFGIKCKELWLPDTFGYSGQLPQIMNVCGINRFLTQKISWNLVNKFPHHNFVWQGIDGSSVLVHFPPADSYEANIKVDEILKTVRNLLDKGRVNNSMLLYGYGDGGGGPTDLMLERQKRLENTNCLPKVKLSTPDTFFSTLESDRHKLCRWVGELFLELHNGTYTTHHLIKKENRQSEFSLRDAEFLSSLCLIMSGNQKVYPADEIDAAWKLVLLNQFHDVLPGSSISMVYEDAHRYYAKALGVAADISQNCLELLFGQPNGRTLVVNTLSWDRITLLSIEGIMLNNLTRTNSGVHHQDLKSGKKLIYVSAPAMGYVLVTELQPIIHCVIAEKLPSGLFHMRNEFLEVFLDSAGRITSLKVFENDMEAVAADYLANQFVTFSDIPLYWDAWDVMDYHLETRQELSQVAEEASIIEKGPLRATILVKLQISAKSWIEQRISVDVAHPYVRVDTTVAWHESHRFLKFHQDILSDHPTNIQRDDQAVCGHKWVDLSEHDWGVAILNESCYGHSVHDNIMSMSLLRSPKSPDADADMGNHEFSYAVYPHKGTFQSARVVQHAYELNVPAKLLTSSGKVAWGDQAPEENQLINTDFRHSWFTVSNPAIILETIKKSEVGVNQLVLRLFETYGSHCTTHLKTSLTLTSARFCNAAEELIDSKILEFNDQCLTLTFKPFEIMSIQITF